MRLAHLVVAAALAAWAAPAMAAITTITMTGVALSGSDNGHLSAAAPFGTLQLGVDLATGQTFGTVIDRPFTLEFRIDDSLGEVTTVGGYRQIEGFGTDSPIRALFSMNGLEYAFGNEAAGLRKHLVPRDALNGYANECQVSTSRTGDFTEVEGSLSFLIQPARDVFTEEGFTEPALWARSDRGDIGFGSLDLSLQDVFDTPRGRRTGPIRTATLDLRFDTFKISSVTLPPVVVGPPSSAAPEPSAWALLIGGFAVTGVALRARRGRPAASNSSEAL